MYVLNYLRLKIEPDSPYGASVQVQASADVKKQQKLGVQEKTTFILKVHVRVLKAYVKQKS